MTIQIIIHTIIEIMILVLVITLLIKNLINIKKIKQLKVEVESLKFYNNNLNELYDNVRAFRHDFGNIVQALGGYINTENIEGLKEMYKDLFNECEQNKQLEILNPNIINNAAICNIINQKYQRAKKENVQMKIENCADLQNIKIKTYEFARILGILLDNALEATKNQENKVIELKIFRESKANRNVIIIKNTFNKEKIDIERIFEKGYSTKKTEKQKHGLGLWEVRKILNKNNNLNLYTTIEGDYFKQQLEVYDII